MSGSTTLQPPAMLPAAAPDSRTPLGLLIAIVCVMIGTFMQMLDSTIANVALPYMQGSLQASRDQITWVLTSYVTAAAITTGPIGWLAARFGRREIFLVSLVGFTVSSMLCGVAQNLGQMIAFRLAQGVFGASFSPLSQAIILDRYPLEQRGRIMAVWSIVVMLGPILGPTIGGFLTDSYSWRWVFYVNVPIGVLSMLGIFFFLDEPARPAPPRFDWYGFSFLGLALAGLQLMLDRGQDQDWFSSPEIIAEAVIAGLGFYLFLVQIFTVEHPFLDRKMLRDRNFVSGVLLTFFVGLMLMATTALLPPYLQSLGGYSVFDTGLLLAPRGVGTMLTMVLVGRIVMKVDTRGLMLLGSLILLWTMWEMNGWTPAVPMLRLGVTTFVQGVAMGFIFVPSNLYTFSTLPQALRTEGASVLNLARNVGSAIGVSITTAVLTVSSQTAYSQIAARATPFNRALSVNAPGMMLNPQTPLGARDFNLMALQQSAILAYADTFLFMFYCSFPVLILILLLRKVDLMKAGQPQMEALE